MCVASQSVKSRTWLVSESKSKMGEVDMDGGLGWQRSEEGLNA